MDIVLKVSMPISVDLRCSRCWSLLLNQQYYQRQTLTSLVRFQNLRSRAVMPLVKELTNLHLLVVPKSFQVPLV